MILGFETLQIKDKLLQRSIVPHGSNYREESWVSIITLGNSFVGQPPPNNSDTKVKDVFKLSKSIIF